VGLGIKNALLNVVVELMSPPMMSKTPSVGPLASDRISNVSLMRMSL